MSVRLPSILTQASRDDGISGFESEVAHEKAISLGIAGGKVGRALAALKAVEEPDAREAALNAAADAVHAFLIQREACGLRDPRLVVEDYDIPRQVMARLGVSRRGSKTSRA